VPGRVNAWLGLRNLLPLVPKASGRTLVVGSNPASTMSASQRLWSAEAAFPSVSLWLV